MASIYKIKQQRKLPPNPDIVTRKGKKYLRVKRDGRYSLFPLTKCGTKYQEESAKWYVQYYDANGKRQRVPGYTDKEATLQLAAELKRKSERIQSGLADPHETGKLLPLENHLEDFRAFLQSKSNSAKHVNETCSKIKKLIGECKFERWIDIVASGVVRWLASQRTVGNMGARTSNSYLKSFKHFCSWLENDGRVPKKKNPVEHLSIINAEADIRWERRAMSPEEFTWLVKAANSGPDVQCVSGPDRAMLYIVAAWTGYRRGELASLTLGSFSFETNPPTVQVKASYSKRRRNDIVPLHPTVVEQLKDWLAAKGKIERTELLFNLRANGGSLRKTSKMMRLDLERARAAWVDEAKDDQEEQKRREESDFLCYQNEKGMYADFHANRHTFITNLAKAGIHPKLAQSVARHSDVNLTLGIYSHVEVAEQAEAINALPAPPSLKGSSDKGQENTEAKETEAADARDEKGPEKTEPQPPKEVDRVALLVALKDDFDCLQSILDDIDCLSGPSGGSCQNLLYQKDLVAFCQALASDDTSAPRRTRTFDPLIKSQLLCQLS